MLYFDQGPAALSTEEEQLLAGVIGPWVTSSPIPRAVTGAHAPPNAGHAPDGDAPHGNAPHDNPSPTTASPSPSPDGSSGAPTGAAELRLPAVPHRGFTVGWGSHPPPF